MILIIILIPTIWLKDISLTGQITKLQLWILNWAIAIHLCFVHLRSGGELEPQKRLILSAGRNINIVAYLFLVLLQISSNVFFYTGFFIRSIFFKAVESHFYNLWSWNKKSAKYTLLWIIFLHHSQWFLKDKRSNSP